MEALRRLKGLDYSMVRFRGLILALFIVGLTTMDAKASSFTINTESASKVLHALQNPELTREESLRIAALPGNQGIIKKTKEFGFDATTENFADALYGEAHGSPSTNPIARHYYFELIKPKTTELLAFLGQVTAHPESFQKVIESRISLFTPPDSNIQMQGYMVAGGDGGGYAFGGTDFYMNVGFMNELIVARVNATHELYHGVQGAFAKDRGSVGELPSLVGLSSSQQACLKTRQLFANVYEEGSATYVEDISQLDKSTSDVAKRQRDDLADGIKAARTSARLLEMSVLSLNAQSPMPYDDVYDVDFYGHGVLYSISYVVAKAIAVHDGPAGLTAFLKLPPERFILHYTELPEYGKDHDHPQIGPNTIQFAKAAVKGCDK